MTTKELKKKHSSRLVGGAETGSQGGKERIHSKVVASRPGRQGASWWARWSHIRVWINWEEQVGSKTDHATQDSSVGK